MDSDRQHHDRKNGHGGRSAAAGSGAIKTEQYGAEARLMERKARLAWLNVFWERLWPRLSIFLAVASLFIALSWIGLWRVTPDLVRYVLLFLFGLAGLASLFWIARVPIPTLSEGLRRLETNSGLDHRPATGLSDTLSNVANDDEAKVLWRAHRAWLAKRLRNLKPGVPKPDLIRRDPQGFRFVFIIALFVGAFVAHGEWLTRLGEAFAGPTLQETHAPTRIDAWIDPPAYTRQPPVFLSRLAGEENFSAVTVPEGSALTVRVVSRDPADVVLSEAGLDEVLQAETADDNPTQTSETDTEPVGPTIRSYHATLGKDGAIAITEGETEVRYAFRIIPDNPPSVERGEVTINRSGSFQLEYETQDDYGVTEGTVTFRPQEEAPPSARPLVEPPEVAMRLDRAKGGEATGRAFVRLEDHPYGGLPVFADVVVLDAAEQVGQPEDEGAMTLPTRSFNNPIAKALVDQRRVLALDANKQDHVAHFLDVMTLYPERDINDAGIYLGLRTAYNRLISAENDDQLRAMLDYLWAMAVGIEDGDLSEAQRRLNEARQALEDALANGASEEEIARLTEELRQAMNEFLQSMMQQMAQQNQNGEMPSLPTPEGQLLTQDDLNQMLDRMQDLAELGDMQAAQDLLNQLQSLLDNLQMAQRGQMQPGGESGEMMQQLEELGRLMQEQQRLMDDTFSLNQGQRPSDRNGQQQQQGQQGPLSPNELAELLEQLQRGQSDLHDGLQELMEQLQQQGQQGQPSDQFPFGSQPGQQGGQNSEGSQQSLGRAGRAMDDAARMLGEGDSGQAFGRQGEALDALREGLEGMMQDMFAQQGTQPGQQQSGRGPTPDQIDPLGRPQRTEGPDFGESVKLPEERDLERARRTLNAIREKLGERYRPQFELEYLERLLNQQ